MVREEIHIALQARHPSGFRPLALYVLHLSRIMFCCFFCSSSRAHNVLYATARHSFGTYDVINCLAVALTYPLARLLNTVLQSIFD